MEFAPFEFGELARMQQRMNALFSSFLSPMTGFLLEAPTETVNSMDTGDSVRPKRGKKGGKQSAAKRNKTSESNGKELAATQPGGMMTGLFLPKMDVSETEKELRVICELPGLKKTDVDITVDNGVLSIKGERAKEEEQSGDTWRRRERIYGKFSRQFPLPKNYVVENIKASMDNGVLRVIIPKTAETPKGNRITIN